jgi:DNA modification methylase
MNYELHLGDNREALRSMPSDSVDSIVCDPPYELGFMGKKWDSTGIAYDVTLWAECLRVLKPGGHLLAFGGSRTYHRLAVAIEDAGFEIRDCIMWIYSTGFPKSLAVDKAIDKQRHDRAQVYQVTAWIRKARDNAGLSNGDIDKAFGFHGMAGHWTSSASQPSVPTLDQIPPLLALFGMTLDDVPDDIRTLIWTLNGRKRQPGEAWYQREVVGYANHPSGLHRGSIADYSPKNDDTYNPPITAPSTDLAKQWHGWGTALKPAHEPIVVARKSLQGTVADNVTAWGVGALNIDGCRVEGDVGRWPANIILDEEAAQMLDEQSGWSMSSANLRHNTGTPSVAKGKEYPHISIGHSDSGGASRFFYVAKASKAEREAGLEGMEVKVIQERNKDSDFLASEWRIDPRSPNGGYENKPTQPRANNHPTVKPIALMRYLVRMVTPRGGVVLDPFMGSGTTGCAAMLEAVRFIGIDITPEYVDIAERRIQHWASQNPMEL